MVNIEKFSINPDLDGTYDFERGKNRVQSITLEDNVIKIRFEYDNPIKSINIPIVGLIEIEYGKDTEWDVKLISLQKDITISYKRWNLPEGFDPMMMVGGPRR